MMPADVVSTMYLWTVVETPVNNAESKRSITNSNCSDFKLKTNKKTTTAGDTFRTVSTIKVTNNFVSFIVIAIATFEQIQFFAKYSYSQMYTETYAQSYS